MRTRPPPLGEAPPGRFSRAPSGGLRAALTPGGWLAPLLQPRSVHTPMGPLPTHIGFRPGDARMIYCGSARLLVASWTPDHTRIAADPHHARQPAGRALFRTWRAGEPGLEAALARWFAAVVPNATQVRGEGRAQALWHAVCSPWRSFDHEARFAHDSAAHRRDGLHSTPVHAATQAVAAHGRAQPRPWSTRLPSHRDGNSRDQLAVDDQGALVVIELKHGAARRRDSVYLAPLQLLRYLHEDARQLPQQLASVQALLDARIALGLLPAATPRLTGVIRPVVAWGDDPPSAEVGRRAAVVAGLIGAHRPPGCLPIEIWGMPGGAPVRLC